MKRASYILSMLALSGLLTLGSTAFAQTSQHADVPKTISYQGILSSNIGTTTIDGTYPITVTLYADSHGNSPIWTGTYSTTLHDGVFDISLGSGDFPLPEAADMDRPLWAGVSIDGGQEMRPLTALTSSPYAMNVADGAISAEKIADGAVTPEKLDMDYVSGVLVNGQKVTGRGTSLNLVGGGDIALRYDEASGSLRIESATNQGTSTKKGASTLAAANDAWAMGGDAVNLASGLIQTVTSGNWIGTSGTAPSGGTPYLDFDIKVNNTQVMKYQPNGTNTPNIVGGHSGNTILAGAIGSIIAAGGDPTSGPNMIWGNSDGVMLYDVVSGGRENTILGDGVDPGEGSDYDVIVGGLSNRIGKTDGPVDYSAIGGGYFNNIDNGHYNTIAGGKSNFVTGGGCAIGGGEGNWATSAWGTVAGGYGNQSTQPLASILGGKNNLASGSTSTVGGGENIVASGSYGAAFGGYDNQATGSKSFIGGGEANRASAGWTVVTGGQDNHATQNWAFAGGGQTNSASGITSVVVGGTQNTASGIYSSIVGGHGNSVTFNGSIVGGGNANVIDAQYSGILGGIANSINSGAGWSAIGGGGQNLITANGINAVIPGGDALTAQSYAQTVLGYYNKPRGSMGQRPNAPTTKASNDPLVIVGNGDYWNGVQSNAFEVSYNGHSTVYDINDNTFGGGRTPIRGATYVDNTIVAWGYITPGGGVVSDFGVAAVAIAGPGVYSVTLSLVDPDGNPVTLTDESITATLVQDGPPNQPIACGSIVVSPIQAVPANTFYVRTGLIANGACLPQELPFMFKVVGRP